MAKPSRQKEFEQEFRSHIEAHRASLIKALRAITKAKPAPQVKVLSFEIQSDWSTFPVYLFTMDDEAPDEVDSDPPFYGELLKDAGRLIPSEAIDQESYEEAGVATFESGARVLAEWFGECWHAAGGAAFPIGAYIHHHDRSSYYDLRACRWVQDSDIWPNE
jgi:hypothetical protein